MTFTDAQLKTLYAVLAAAFPGRVPKPTGLMWFGELAAFDVVDVEHGIREHARTSVHPSLVGLLECVRKAKTDRLAHVEIQQRLSRKALPAGRLDVEATRKANAAKASAVIAELGRKTAIPAVAKQEGASGPAQTQEQADQRRSQLQAQKEQIEREAMRDAFSESVSEDDGGAR